LADGRTIGDVHMSLDNAGGFSYIIN